MANIGLLPRMLGGGAGKIGVAVFFVLSGFLMAYRYAGQPFVGGQVREYIRQRAGRVVPLFYVIVLLSMTLANTPLKVYDLDRAGGVGTHLAFIRGAEVLWTIPVEIHFYVVFLGLWWAAARGMKFTALGAAFGVFAGLALIFRAYGVSSDTLPFWGHYFLVGAAIGLLKDRFGAVRTWFEGRPGLAAAAGWLAAALFAFALPGVRALVHVPAVDAWADPFAAVGAATFFGGALFELGPMKVLATPPFRWVGGVSYGLYLLHTLVLIPLYTALDPQTVPEKTLTVALVTVASLALAWLSLRYFERPAMRFLGGVARGGAKIRA